MKLPNARSESGTTLVEMTISMLILGIVLASAFQAFTSYQRVISATDIRLQNLDEGRVLMDVTSKDLRTAAMLTAGSSPFLLADIDHVIYYANLNSTGGPKKVEIYIDRTNPTAPVLIEKVTNPDPGSSPPTYNGQPPAVRYVGRYVANASSSPVFTFYDAAGVALPVPMSGSNANLLAIRSVGINLAIRQSNGANVPATTLINRVSLPNVYYNIRTNPTP
jgi:type II secretory pathway pseudopilin PulG